MPLRLKFCEVEFKDNTRIYVPNTCLWLFFVNFEVLNMVEIINFELMLSKQKLQMFFPKPIFSL